MKVNSFSFFGLWAGMYCLIITKIYNLRLEENHTDFNMGTFFSEIFSILA